MPTYNIEANLINADVFKTELQDDYEVFRGAMVEKFKAECSSFLQKWAKSAEKKLKTSSKYIQHIMDGVKPAVETDTEYIFQVEHDYRLPNGRSLTLMLEYGYDAFDLKERLFDGKNVKVSKKGFLYAYVPFTYHNPFKVGEQTRPPFITDEHKEAFHRLKKNGYVARDLNDEGGENYATLNSKNLKEVGYDDDEIKGLLGPRKTKTGLYHLKSVDKQKTIEHFEHGNRIQKTIALKHERDKLFAVNYKWKTPQFKGLTEMKGKKGHVYKEYTTIRTMTTATNQNQAWIHPGLEPLNIFNDVYNVEKEDIPRRMEIAMKEFISSVSGNPFD